MRVFGIKKSIILLIILSVCAYRISRPTIIFHTQNRSGYLGKVSRFNGEIDKLYVKDSIAKYQMPHIWNWSKDDEIAIFLKNENFLYTIKDISFWREHIYLDKYECYEKHYRTDFLGRLTK
ncbi:MAG: hypothetical protein ACK5IQ_10125 [Bacteroidales bacterium]